MLVDRHILPTPSLNIRRFKEIFLSINIYDVLEFLESINCLVCIL